MTNVERATNAGPAVGRVFRALNPLRRLAATNGGPAARKSQRCNVLLARGPRPTQAERVLLELGWLLVMVNASTMMRVRAR